MNIPIDFDENGGEFRAISTVPIDADSGYRQYVWEQMRKEIGMKLYGLIEQTKTPVTIDISEKIIEYPKVSQMYYTAPPDKLEIRIVFTPVRYRDVIIPSKYYNNHPTSLFVETKLDRFYSKVRKWIYRGTK